MKISIQTPKNIDPIVYGKSKHRRGGEHYSLGLPLDVTIHPRFFDQVGHQTKYVSIGNRHFFTMSCHRQTYQNYEQSRQKLGTFLENKVLQKSKFSKNFIYKR